MCILWFVQVCRAPGDILERRQLCPRAGDLKTNLRYHQTLNKDKAPLSAYKKIIKWTITSELLDLNWLLATAQNFCLCTKLLLFRHCCQKVLADSVQIVSFFHEWNQLQGSEKSVQLQLAPTLRHQACGNVNFHHHHASPFLPKPFPSFYTSASFSFDTLALVEMSQTGVGKEIWSFVRKGVVKVIFFPFSERIILFCFFKFTRPIVCAPRASLSAEISYWLGLILSWLGLESQRTNI